MALCELTAVYPIAYNDCIALKIRQDKHVNNSNCLALGVNMEGQKEFFGIRLPENEGPKFWLNVLAELQNSGVKGQCYPWKVGTIYNYPPHPVDGLKGFPDAIDATYSEAQTQPSTVHIAHNSVK